MWTGSPWYPGCSYRVFLQTTLEPRVPSEGLSDERGREKKEGFLLIRLPTSSARGAIHHARHQLCGSPQRRARLLLTHGRTLAHKQLEGSATKAFTITHPALVWNLGDNFGKFPLSIIHLQAVARGPVQPPPAMPPGRGTASAGGGPGVARTEYMIRFTVGLGTGEGESRAASHIISSMRKQRAAAGKGNIGPSPIKQNIYQRVCSLSFILSHH